MTRRANGWTAIAGWLAVVSAVGASAGCRRAATSGGDAEPGSADGAGTGAGAGGGGDAVMMAQPKIVSSAELEARATGAPGQVRGALEPGTVEVGVGRPGDGAPCPRGIERRAPERELYLALDTPYQSWGDEGTFVHVAAYTKDFGPAKGAEVYLNGRRIGETDEHGAFSFRRVPVPGEDIREGEILVRLGGKQAWLTYQASSRTSSFEMPTIYVYTDRGVYNPGQTIRVRAIAWKLRGDYVPVDGEDVRLELLDGTRRIVGGGVLRTDRWGVGAVDLPLPANAREGRYVLAAVLAEERAEAFVRIERFVPPVIDIKHDLGRFLTPDVAELPFTVRLGYFGGGTFASGDVTVTAKVGERELFREARAVTGEGPHAFLIPRTDLRAIQDAASEGGIVTIEIAVRDGDGRRDVQKRDLRFTRNPYKAVIELDRTQYAAGDPVQAMFRLVDIDGVPIRDREVTLEIPGRTNAVQRTDEGGVARFTFPAPPIDASRSPEIRARLADVAEPVASAWVYVTEPMPMRSAIAETVVRERAEVPVEIVFPADVVPAEDVVHADIVDSSGSLIFSFLVPVVREGGTVKARGTFRAPSWGSMLLTLWCLGKKGDDVGLMTDGQNLAVHPGRALTIAFRGVPQQASPGEALRVGVDVTGPEGRRGDAVLGAAVVDQAVLSMLDPLERSPVDRFYNPERKVLASTGAQTLTWPVVQRNWGDDRYDIGWPATFGFHSGRETIHDEGEKEKMAGAAPGAPPMAAEPSPPADLAEQGSMGRRSPGEGEEPSGQPRARLVLRTDFSETSFWEPRLVAAGGHAELDLTLPDSITVQNLTVVASDDTGGIGLGRVQIPVRQALYARSDLPATMTEGDRLEVGVAVRNLSGQAQQATVSLRSTALTVEGGDVPLTVEPDGTGVARFTVTATRPGLATYEIAAETSTVAAGGERLRDVELRRLFVRPRGAPETTVERGTAKAGAPYSVRFQTGPDDRWSVVRLGVALPLVVPALPGLLELFDDAYWGPDPAASRTLAAAAAYRWLDGAGKLNGPQRDELRGKLGAAASAILMGQNDDGGWGWFWDRGSVPYITAYALDALTELRELDFPVPDDALRRAGEFLLRSMGADGLFEMSAIAPWEGDDPGIRLAATAQIFAALARLSGGAQPYEWEHSMRKLAGRFVEVLDAAAPDPLTLAYAVLALHRVRSLLEIDDPSVKLVAAAQRLAAIRRETHWEPGWFEAFGGTVEAAAVALEVLHELAPADFEAAKREAVQVLLSSRGAWGEWHNERSTAFAIRALLLLDPAPEGAPGTIAIAVDGNEIRRATADPSDPYGAALELRELELPALPSGAHTVVVTHDGTLAAEVTLEVQRWIGPPPVRVAAAGAVEIERSVPPLATAGALTDAAYSIRPPEGAGPMRLVQPLPSSLSPERSSLDALVESGNASAWSFDGSSLVVDLPTAAQHVFIVRLSVNGTGSFTVPPAVVSSPLRPEITGSSAAGTISVEP